MKNHGGLNGAAVVALNPYFPSFSPRQSFWIISRSQAGSEGVGKNRAASETVFPFFFTCFLSHSLSFSPSLSLCLHHGQSQWKALVES